MKPIIIAIIVGVSLFPPLASALSDNRLPEELTRYYKGRNFVAAFSTRNERSALMYHRSSLAWSDPMVSKRLLEIVKQIQTIQAQEMRIDQGILLHHNSIKSKLHISKELMFPGLMAMDKVERKDEDTLVIRLLVYKLNSKLNTKLISQYDIGKTIPPIPDNLPASLTISHRVIHGWVKRKGQWFKKPGGIALIKD